MARLYANENFPLPVVVELRRLGHDVLTIQETGRGSARVTDLEVLASSAADGRVVLTLNRKHFVRLHQERPDHSGIIACSFDSDFTAQAARIHEALLSAGVLVGQLIRIDRPRR